MEKTNNNPDDQVLDSTTVEQREVDIYALF